MCYCLFIFYELVCGMDGLVYFFFCYVGCRFNYKWMDGFMGKFKVYISIVCFIFKKLFVYICFELKNNWVFFRFIWIVFVFKIVLCI